MTTHKEIFGIIERTNREGEKISTWVRIGTAFENKDGSFNLKLNFFPTDPGMTLNMREPRPREQREAAE